MVKGTHSMGKKAKGKSSIICRRCGNTSYFKKKRICSSCGFGRSKKLRNYNWSKKK